MNPYIVTIITEITTMTYSVYADSIGAAIAKTMLTDELEGDTIAVSAFQRR